MILNENFQNNTQLTEGVTIATSKEERKKVREFEGWTWSAVFGQGRRQRQGED